MDAYKPLCLTGSKLRLAHSLGPNYSVIFVLPSKQAEREKSKNDRQDNPKPDPLHTLLDTKKNIPAQVVVTVPLVWVPVRLLNQKDGPLADACGSCIQDDSDATKPSYVHAFSHAQPRTH
jgi:hypothetical protein